MFWCIICELDCIVGNSCELDEVNFVLWLVIGEFVLIVFVKYWKVVKYMLKIYIVFIWILKDVI